MGKVEIWLDTGAALTYSLAAVLDFSVEGGPGDCPSCFPLPLGGIARTGTVEDGPWVLGCSLGAPGVGGRACCSGECSNVPPNNAPLTNLGYDEGDGERRMRRVLCPHNRVNSSKTGAINSTFQ